MSQSHSQPSSTDSNERTIAAYQDHIQEYAENTPQEVSGWMKDWLDSLVAGLPPTARILELGGATGRDAAYLQTLGYSIETTDAVPGFVQYMLQRQLNARKLNLITDPIAGQYDLIIAKAVLLHFTDEELTSVLAKIHAALDPKGKFGFTVKEGTGEEWASHKLGTPRYFRYWTEATIGERLAAAGFTHVDITPKIGARETKWLKIIARAQ